MSEDTYRSVRLERIDRDHYTARNARGGTLNFGTGGDELFTPVEMLLAAIGGCSSIDVDYIVSKRAEPQIEIVVSGDKIRDEQGNRMTNLRIEFAVQFPEGEDGDRAREVLPRAVAQSHDRLCTVSRTVEIGTPVTAEISR